VDAGSASIVPNGASGPSSFFVVWRPRPHWARASIAGSTCLSLTIVSGDNISDELAANFQISLFVAKIKKS
jgi:hypothetical protein